MPPPEAVAGTYVGPDGNKIKVAPLTDEDRRTLVRWIDLGCPIDLDFDPAHPENRGHGWMLDDQRPTLTLSSPEAGGNLVKKFKALPDYRWELQLTRPLTELPQGKLTVSIKDKQGNVSRIER